MLLEFFANGVDETSDSRFLLLRIQVGVKCGCQVLHLQSQRRKLSRALVEIVLRVR